MRITSERYPYLPVSFTIEGHVRSVEALVDTGFDGDLAIPTVLVPNSVFAAAYQAWRLADGSAIQIAVYVGTVQIGRFDAVPALIAATGEEAIIGRGIIDRYLVLFDHGERVSVES